MRFVSTGVILLIVLNFSAGAAQAQSHWDQQNNAAYVGLHLSLPFSQSTKVPSKSFKLGFRAGYRRDIYRSQHGILRSDVHMADLAQFYPSDQAGSTLSLSMVGMPVARRDAFGRVFYLDPEKEDDKGMSQATFLKWAGVALGAATIFSFVVADSIKDRVNQN